MGSSLSGYESFEPGIGLGGLVLTPPVPTITIPPLPSSELDLLDFSGWKLFEPILGLGGLLPSFSPTFAIPPLAFSAFVVFCSMVHEPFFPGTRLF